MPHARIRSIDTAAALAMPGVLAVLTGADAVADKLGDHVALCLAMQHVGLLMDAEEAESLIARHTVVRREALDLGAADLRDLRFIAIERGHALERERVVAHHGLFALERTKEA